MKMQMLIVNNSTLANMYARLSYCVFTGITDILSTLFISYSPSPAP